MFDLLTSEDIALMQSKDELKAFNDFSLEGMQNILLRANVIKDTLDMRTSTENIEFKDLELWQKYMREGS